MFKVSSNMFKVLFVQGEECLFNKSLCNPSDQNKDKIVQKNSGKCEMNNIFAIYWTFKLKWDEKNQKKKFYLFHQSFIL